MNADIITDTTYPHGTIEGQDHRVGLRVDRLTELDGDRSVAAPKQAGLRG